VNPFDGITRLFTSRVHGVAPMDDKFVRPDREATAKSMRLEERGAEQGQLNLPPSNSSDLDVVEREIVAAVSEHMDSAHIDTCQHLRSYEDRLSDLHLLHGLGSIRGETKKTLGDIKALVAEWQDRLATRRDALRASYGEMESFRHSHGLKRPYHKVESRWIHGSTIAVAWFAETGGNTIFLSQNNSMGLIGGVVAAAFVSLLNVAMAVFAGVYLWRRTNFEQPSARAFAWLGIALWLVFTFAWNLTAGHFRDAQAAGVPDPQAAAIHLMRTTPVMFDSFYSWGMLLVGLLAAIVSAHEGYKMNDPYPGYGALGELHDNRCAEYADLVAEARESLAEQRDRAIEAAQAIKDELGIQLRQRAQVHAAHQHLIRRFEGHHAQLLELTNYLLETYRNSNRRARSNPAPEHFNKPYSLSRLPLPDLHEAPLDEAKIETAERTLNEGIDVVTSAFDNAIDSFTPLEALKKDLASGTL
jgi:hypothetical protein